jgi:cell division protein FtsB
VRRLAAVLALLLVAIQWPLWFGRGGWFRVWDLQRQLNAEKATLAEIDLRNQALLAELRSLSQGTEAVEERAREQLHFIRSGEIFFQRPTVPPDTRPDSTPLQ